MKLDFKNNSCSNWLILGVCIFGILVCHKNTKQLENKLNEKIKNENDNTKNMYKFIDKYNSFVKREENEHNMIDEEIENIKDEIIICYEHIDKLNDKLGQNKGE